MENPRVMHTLICTIPFALILGKVELTGKKPFSPRTGITREDSPIVLLVSCRKEKGNVHDKVA
jgi:hypothetical protein